MFCGERRAYLNRKCRGCLSYRFTCSVHSSIFLYVCVYLVFCLSVCLSLSLSLSLTVGSPTFCGPLLPDLNKAIKSKIWLLTGSDDLPHVDFGRRRKHENDVVERHRADEVEDEPSLEIAQHDQTRHKDYFFAIFVRNYPCAQQSQTTLQSFNFHLLLTSSIRATNVEKKLSKSSLNSTNIRTLNCLNCINKHKK